MTRLATPPPDEITLVYRPVGPSHVFTASGPEMCGFHISSPKLKVAFDLARASLGRHVALIYGGAAEYEFEHSFEAFEADLNGESLCGNIVKARITHREVEKVPEFHRRGPFKGIVSNPGLR